MVQGEEACTLPVQDRVDRPGTNFNCPVVIYERNIHLPLPASGIASVAVRPSHNVCPPWGFAPLILVYELSP